MAYSNKGELNYAIEDFTKVMKLEPNYIKSYSNSSKAQLQMGVCEDVRADLTTARNMERNFITPLTRDHENASHLKQKHGFNLPKAAAAMLASRQA